MPGRDANDQPAASKLSIAGTSYLLVTTGGFRVHLAAPDEDTRPRSTPSPAGTYRGGRVVEAEVGFGWRPRTLCGREWLDVVTEADEVWAPDCRSCLRLVDRHLPSQSPDERVSTLAQLVRAAVVEHGSAEVLGVPGDQLAVFRAAVRAELKARGLRSQTFVEGELLLVMSDDARQAMSDDALRRRQLMLTQAIQRISLGADAPPIDTSGWTFRWSDWSS